MLITQSLRRAARLASDRTALTSETVTLTWAQLAARIPRIAGGLHGLGFSPGDRIAVLAQNVPAFHELYLAAPWAGLVMASLNMRWSVREMIDAMNDCSARGLVIDDAFLQYLPELRRGVPTLSRVISATAPLAAADADWEDLCQNGRPIEDASPAPDSTAYLFYTGGTTGRAKGVMISARNFLTAGLSSLATGGYKASSTIILSVPLFHMSGGGLVAAQLASAARIHLLPKFEARASLAAVEKARGTHVVWVPTMLSSILNDPSFGSYDLSSLQRIIYGSAPMPPALLARALKAMPGVGFTQYYGMTELTGNATTLAPEDHAPSGAGNARLRSVGKPIPGAEVKIVRPDGEEAETGEIGEIVVAGPVVMGGYWGQPEKTAEAIREGWMQSGDLGFADKDGFVFIVDRSKDVIISGGENVYSSEVEHALYSHPAISECAVIGLPDEKWGEIVCAIVHLAPGAPAPGAEELVAHCRTQIGGFKIPRRIIFAAAPLPKSAAGKILKTDIRAVYGKG